MGERLNYLVCFIWIIVEQEPQNIVLAPNAVHNSDHLEVPYIGVGRGGARGGQAPPNNLRGGANIPFGPPNNPLTFSFNFYVKQEKTQMYQVEG